MRSWSMEVDATDANQRIRSFVLVTVPGALVAWHIGFEIGAFDTVAYQRVFSVFVVSRVVLLASFVAAADGTHSSAVRRFALATPLLYLVVDLLFLDESPIVSKVLGIAVIATLPYALWVAARLMGVAYFELSRRDQIAVVVSIVVIGAGGLYVGANHDRFVTCSDFERAGDYLPENCRP